MNEYWLGVFTLVGVYMIAVLGVSILCGFTGMFSLGHAGFMAVGAYISALLTKSVGLPMVISIVAAVVVTTLLGMLLTYPTMKLRDDYFLIVTLGIGEAIKLVIQNTTDLTGGARGLADIPKGVGFVQVWGLLLVIVVLLYSFVNSKQGRNCIAVREEELAAQSVGISLVRQKMTAMAISCALCGLSGALLAHYMGYLQPNMFNMTKSNELIIIVVLGGRGSLIGTILAGLVMLPLPELLRFGGTESWRMVIYGLLVALVIIFRPDGLMGTHDLSIKGARRLFARLAGRKAVSANK